MPSRKTWKFLGIGFVGGILGSAGLVAAAIFVIALWPSSPSTSGVVLSSIGCPSGMLENMFTARCEMSEETEETVSAALRKLSEIGGLDRFPSRHQIRDIATEATDNQTLMFKLYRLAAFLGDAESQYEVGGMLSKGKGTKETKMEALRWLHEAAHSNHLDAQVRLAHMLSTGLFVKRDKQLANKWLKRAEANRNQPQLAEAI
jgi:hypothetical protein